MFLFQILHTFFTPTGSPLCDFFSMCVPEDMVGTAQWRHVLLKNCLFIHCSLNSNMAQQPVEEKIFRIEYKA